MAKPPSSAAAAAAGGRGPVHNRTRLLLVLLVAVAASASTAGFLLRGALRDPCDGRGDPAALNTAVAAGSPLGFMRSKLVLLVSHELSLSGGPLLLMELAFLLRHVGSEVVWITNQRSEETNDVTYSLEHRMLSHGVQVLPARGQEAVDIALKADLVILNTAVAGKWLDPVLKDHVPKVLPKILWWIHEMRGHYFKVEYVKHLPFVAGAMIDSHTTAEYWKSRTSDRLKIQMPQTYVVHLGNSKELMEVAEDNVARRVLREHIRESLGVRSEDLLFAIINSVSRGKGQDLFLQAFYQGLQLIQHQKLKVPTMHAIVVGSDMNAQTKFETQLRDFVVKNAIHDRVHFVNKTLAVAPYLAAIDVLVQNSQARGECFGRITIEAMAFKLPVLGTAAGGTTEIVLDGSTGLLHPAGKEGVTPLAKNIVRLASHAEQRVSMGEKGYDRVKEMFMEHHMAERIAAVLKEVLQKSQERSRS
ncbi:hypothetical protein BDA96_03G126300 [Sorghum bicolor]|uniref:Glycosyl transferase family 1 domain-containing protein n=3 Tax=Sorghum bicolor TaxID=4558 RepID=A0A1B6Q2R5_SORBI|nr:uncharacterized protein LOC110433885 [Sorghum bicolor]KAG0537183.1 hypothetical protein BDA96_03G126300 [Sorghum bicolor]KXG32213.1 hypothetical protein SORBI_3003G120700 [Sorghum bicolor]|eukprot:XP_021312519.1 uncharacterized protein LOC110433885 [Sorghum bicolor]